MHFAYILNIDIDIAIFCKYSIDMVSKLKKWYRSITSATAAASSVTSRAAGVADWLQQQLLVIQHSGTHTHTRTHAVFTLVAIRCRPIYLQTCRKKICVMARQNNLVSTCYVAIVFRLFVPRWLIDFDPWLPTQRAGAPSAVVLRHSSPRLWRQWSDMWRKYVV